MKVVNDNNIGNPYHDEEGKFTTSDGVGSGGPSTPSSDDDYTDDDLLGLYDELFSDDVEENEELQKLFGEYSEPEQPQENILKPIGKMSQEELLTEIHQRIQNLANKNISVAKNFFSDDLYLKCGALRQIDAVIEKYGINNFLPSGYQISSYNKDGRNAAWAFAEASGNLLTGLPNTRLRCNRAKMVNFEQVKQNIARAQEIGYWAEVDEDFFAEATVCHEMGHALSYFLFDKKIKSGVVDNLFSDPLGTFMENIKDEVYNIFTSQNPGLGYGDFIRDTSKYGEKNVHEWFAETFMSMNGGKPTKTALALKQWLDEEFNFNGGNK